MNLRWLVVESSVGLSHQVGAVVEQVFAVDPLAVAHAIALVGDEVLGFAVIHAEGREVVHNPLFDTVIVDVIGFGRRACGEGVLIVVVEVREHARVEGAFAWFEASRKADHEAHVGQLLRATSVVLVRRGAMFASGVAWKVRCCPPRPCQVWRTGP